jgi:flagellar biosynthetic protein FliR
VLSFPDLNVILLPLITTGSCILLRLVGVVSVMPFSRSGVLPPRLRATFACYLTITFLFGLGLPLLPPPNSVEGWLVLLLPELVLGLAIGLLVKVLLGSAEAMGQLASTTIGLGFATFVDPSTGTQRDALGRLTGFLAALVFVAVDGHHLVFRAMFDCLRTMPPGSTSLITLSQGGYNLAQLGSHLFMLSLRLAAPVLGGGLILYTVLGVISRVAPQINLFAFGFILTIPAGVLLIMAEMPEFVALFTNETRALSNDIVRWTMTGSVR